MGSMGMGMGGDKGGSMNNPFDSSESAPQKPEEAVTSDEQNQEGTTAAQPSADDKTQQPAQNSQTPEIPSMNGEEIPQMPEGNMQGGFANGDMQMPEMPSMNAGSMPQMPNGGDMQGGMPTPPDGSAQPRANNR